MKRYVFARSGDGKTVVSRMNGEVEEIATIAAELPAEDALKISIILDGLVEEATRFRRRALRSSEPAALPPAPPAFTEPEGATSRAWRRKTSTRPPGSMGRVAGRLSWADEISDLIRERGSITPEELHAVCPRPDLRSNESTILNAMRTRGILVVVPDGSRRGQRRYTLAKAEP